MKNTQGTESEKLVFSFQKYIKLNLMRLKFTNPNSLRTVSLSKTYSACMIAIVE